MSEDYDDIGDRDEDFVLKEDADTQAIETAAKAINEFLYLIGCGHSTQVAFERAVDGETETALVVPSNVRVGVVQ